MTIYKLFRATASEVDRVKFGERHFASYENAVKAREAILREDVESLKTAYSINRRTIGREMAQDGHDRVRVTGAYKKDFCTGTCSLFWYEIIKIETED